MLAGYRQDLPPSPSRGQRSLRSARGACDFCIHPLLGKKCAYTLGSVQHRFCVLLRLTIGNWRISIQQLRSLSQNLRSEKSARNIVSGAHDVSINISIRLYGYWRLGCFSQNFYSALQTHLTYFPNGPARKNKACLVRPAAKRLDIRERLSGRN